MNLRFHDTSGAELEHERARIVRGAKTFGGLGVFGHD
jgi:hypothetical protein